MGRVILFLIPLVLLIVGLVLAEPAKGKKKAAGATPTSSLLVSKARSGGDDEDEEEISSSEYCYDDPSCGPESWTGTCRRGSSQSPVNVNFGSSKKLPSKTIDFHLTGLEVDEYFMQNDGHALLLDFTPTGGDKASFFQGAGLSEIPYKLSHAVFRWGEDEDKGSEHTINGQGFAMEIQLVHYNPKFANLDQAISSDESSAVAIVSTFLQVDPNVLPSESLAPILRNLPKVLRPQPNGLCWIKVNERFDIDELIPDESPTIRILHYSGSLTTPNCDEGVEWFLFTEPSPIAPADVAAFRNLTDEDGNRIKSNVRPVQRGKKGDAPSNLDVDLFELRGITKEEGEVISKGAKVKAVARKKLKSIGKIGLGLAKAILS